jgi:hypothetical protein
MGRTVVEPVRVRVSVWAAVVDAAVPAGAAVAAAVAGDELVDPLLVHPATTSDAMSNAARHAVTKRYELRWAFMVFVHLIIPG